MTDLKQVTLQIWLQEGGSFMQRLRDHGLKPRIQLLRQAFEAPQVEENAYLAQKPRQHVFIREVEICHELQPLLFARTAIPLKVLKGKERQLQFLGTRALGSVLFSYPKVKRSAFDLFSCQLPQYAKAELWGRRSVFQLGPKAVLLTEIFLPALVALIEK